MSTQVSSPTLKVRRNSASGQTFEIPVGALWQSSTLRDLADFLNDKTAEVVPLSMPPGVDDACLARVVRWLERHADDDKTPKRHPKDKVWDLPMGLNHYFWDLAQAEKLPFLKAFLAEEEKTTWAQVRKALDDVEHGEAGSSRSSMAPPAGNPDAELGHSLADLRGLTLGNGTPAENDFVPNKPPYNSFTSYHKSGPPHEPLIHRPDERDERGLLCHGIKPDVPMRYREGDYQLVGFLAADAELFALCSAADYLGIEALLHIACSVAAWRLRGMSVDKLRATFGVANDFAPEEDPVATREFEWTGMRDNEYGVDGLASSSHPEDCPCDDCEYNGSLM
ncbi:hypothetical protein QBC47DRAFT_396281 [Echria macrotheca]|uniref:SKP1 component dimerisation domain-containing protein n=1 Tax=Echria macrotheca TaxID=438768 RepID=A0AAJ0BL39_9PEZI|nr:hypothetical protein QBC47DRAFT_396281 [Echria macrotheca]